MDLDDETYDIKSVKLYGYNKTIKRCNTSDEFEVAHVGTKYTSLNMFERQSLAYDVMERDMDDVKHVAFEGYAFGKSGSRALIQLGEFNGGLKKLFYDKGMGIMIYPPKVVKRFATGDGNADKVMMCNMFREEFPQFYPQSFNTLPQYDDPHADMCDAFWIVETLRNHLVYEILGEDKLDVGTVALLEGKSTKKSSSIVETKLIKKCLNQKKK